MAVEAVKGPDRVEVVIVVDGFGVGGAPDAAAYRTATANTAGNTAASVGGLEVPTLTRWGFGNLTTIAGAPAQGRPEATCAAAVMRSAGNDTPSGHWELFGRPTSTAPAVYPNGFDDELIAELCATWGVARVLANRAMGGLDALERHGVTHLETGAPIVYTSADSVLQVAAHVDAVPLEQLYLWCEDARRICDGRWPVGRIIARPFTGEPGRFERLGGHRRDWSTPPPADGALDRLAAHGIRVAAVGKIGDIFAHRGFTVDEHPDTTAGILALTAALAETWRADGDGGVVVVNVTDTDYRGHARDPRGYAEVLTAIDTHLGELAGQCRPGDRLTVCSDHGNDPTHRVDDHGDAHLDHTRERVPYLTWSPGVTGAHRGEVPMSAVGVELCARFGVTVDGLGRPSP